MDIKLTKKQMRFIDATADEVLFGGAAGGGKSWAQLYDAFLYALKFEGSRQLILRRTFPDLERSLIRESLKMFPREVYSYNQTKHVGRLPNGSLLEFGYCDKENDVYQYQGAEYDTIRFDELTHFTEAMYLYLISRLRGANDYPKQIKSSTNPGGVGHAWVKERFIDIGEWGKVNRVKLGEHEGTRLFIPSLAVENPFLMRKDPGYLKRLDNLSENDRKALKFGDWDVLEGRYFTEFCRDVHVVEPFPIPGHWRRYFALDFGLDGFAGLWAAFDEQGMGWVYREANGSNLLISTAAQMIRSLSANEKITAYLAPSDLWGRMADSGKSQAEMFAENGVYLYRIEARGRVDGWMNLKEWLHPFEESGRRTANLKIFSTCLNLIKNLPLLQHDRHDPNDVDTNPHEITHAPDALRYMLAGRPCRAAVVEEPSPFEPEEGNEESFLRFGM